MTTLLSSPPRLPVIFISGPFRAPTPYGVEENCRRAEAAALEVWRAGAVAICVHAMCRHYSGAAPDSVWLAGDLEILRRCDAVLLVEGWEASSGTRGEIEEAERLGIPVWGPYDWGQALEAIR